MLLNRSTPTSHLPQPANVLEALICDLEAYAEWAEGRTLILDLRGTFSLATESTFLRFGGIALPRRPAWPGGANPNVHR